MSQKFENQLNLALETPEELREQTRDLNAGYDPGERCWELIVKYHGTEGELRASFAEGTLFSLEILIAGYAILKVPERFVEQVAANPLVEYVEKPKMFYNTQEGPAARACIAGVVARDPFLSGSGVLLAIIDSGVAYWRNEFRKADGRTRIRSFWDQTLESDDDLPGPPEGFEEGVEFDESRINYALEAGTEAERFERMPVIDVSGHGTAVAGIAAASNVNGYQGVAAGAELLIVKLGGDNGDLDGHSKTTEIMRAVTYCIRKGQEFDMPVVINLSFGNTYGAHDGSSLLERFLDNAAQIGKTVICVGSGNEASSAGHVMGRASERRSVDLVIAEYERNLSVQTWKHYGDSYQISLRAPGGTVISLMPSRFEGSGGGYVLWVENTRLLVYFGEPTPYSVSQELYLEMLPAEGSFLTAGIWRFTLEPVRIVTGEYFFYLPPAVTRNAGTGFLESAPDATLTIPSTAAKVITVGACDEALESYADFSGRGYGMTWLTGERAGYGAVKPDVVAAGVNLLAPDPFGGYVTLSGTSFSTPIVSGSAALLMEWGIVKGRDRFLYGEKVKAYLRAGAQPLRGETIYPNEKVGYGKACVAESLPRR